MTELDPVMSALGRQVREDLEADALTISDDDPLAAALAAPLGDEFKAALKRRLEAERVASEPGLEASSTSGTVLPFERRPSTWLGALAALLAVGIAMSLFLRDPFLRDPSSMSTPSAGDPLSGYRLDVRGTDTTRSGASDGADGADAVLVKVGETLDLRLQPATNVRGELALAVFVQAADGTLRRWPEAEAAAKAHDSGTLRVALPWTWGAGDWTLWARVLRPGQDPGRPPTASGAEPLPPTGGDWLGARLRAEP